MTKLSSSSQPIPWRALILGAILGYVMAVISNGGGTHHSSLVGRFLQEEAEAGPEEGPHGGGEEGHHGVEEEEKEEEEEEEIDVALLDLTIVVIILFLIVLTILFEVVKEGIEESADVSMEPVIEGLFGELTVLGFLSVVTFCVTKLGWFEKLSEHFFEESEELLEIFEAVHYMLFFIMVFFVVNVLVLMYGGKVQSKAWWIYNRACRDQKYMEQLDAVLQAHAEEDQQPSFLKHLCHVLFPCRSSAQQLRSDLQLFRGLRYEFVAERSMDPPFAPHAGNKVDDAFDFGRYLTISQAHRLAHMVHLSNSAWIFMAVVTVVFYVVALLVDYEVEPFAWIWAGAGWLFFLLGTYFDYHMIHLISCMAAVFPTQTEAASDGETSALLGAPTLPKWTTVDLDKYIEERPLLPRMCLPKKALPNRQDTLYWMERNGPKIYNRLFQIQMLFTSAYVSLLCLTLLPYMMWGSEQTIEERIIYPIVSLLPVYLLLSRYQVAAANLTMACSVGVHQHPHIIADVNQAVKTADMISSFVFMERLQHAAKSGFAVSESSDSANGADLSSGEMKDALETFDAIDKDKSGKISKDELGEFLKGVNIMVTKDALNAMMKALDKDDCGEIDRAEFLDFYRKHVVVHLDDKGIRKLANDMFEDFDLDGNGEITLGEFKHVIDSYDVGMTVNDIGDLVAELDEHKDGTISRHEFIHLLMVKHRRLFDRTPLPKLE